MTAFYSTVKRRVAWFPYEIYFVFREVVLFESYTLNDFLQTMVMITWLTMGVDYLSMISCLSISSKRKRKWSILTFHNTIWNAAMVVRLHIYRMNWIVLWGEPLRWIYVQSVILLNYKGKKDSSNIWIKSYFTHIQYKE